MKNETRELKEDEILSKLAHEKFNSPNASWRKKKLPIMGCDIDATYSIDRDKYEVQLSFTPDLSQSEKMKLLNAIKKWADFYLNMLRIPDDDTKVIVPS